jgi:hypothetical protein
VWSELIWLKRRGKNIIKMEFMTQNGKVWSELIWLKRRGKNIIKTELMA